VEACHDVPEQLSGGDREDDFVNVEEQIGDAVSIFVHKEASDLDVVKLMVWM
jgi:hypothetical protein